MTQVHTGAGLKCNMGSSGATFTAGGSAGVVTDVSPSNIPSFEICMSPAHPMHEMNPTPPCVPENVSHWTPAADGSEVDGQPAVDTDSTCTCGVAAGNITFTSSGG